jgi:hypothetical protein
MLTLLTERAGLLRIIRRGIASCSTDQQDLVARPGAGVVNPTHAMAIGKR